MSPTSEDLLASLAARYIWWQSPPAALRRPERIIAQVMDLGTLDDADLLESTLGPARLAEVLRTAPAGWFRPRSWSYWHHRLGLTSVPPVP